MEVENILNPIRIYGSWDEGIVFDNHMLKSVFVGYDENQKEIFENTRTQIGELLYQFKYRQNKQYLKEIIELIKDDLDRWILNKKIDLIVPVPPSKKERKYQPVFEIAKEISNYLRKDCDVNLLRKVSKLQVKDGFDISGSIIQNKKINNKKNILIIDDLYSTGATLNEVCKILKKDDNVDKIYCLVLTKTKR